MRRMGKQRGQGLVEFMLILPVLIVMFVGLLDVGRIYYAYVAVTDAAGEGAAYAANYPPDDSGDTDSIDLIRERAQESSAGMVEIDLDAVNVLFDSTDSGEPITVTVGYTFTVLTPVIAPMVPDGTILLQGVATEVIITSAQYD